VAKDSFILYLDQQEIFEMLTDEQAGQLIKNIFLYERTGQMPKMDKMLTLAFVPIMQILDKNRRKYDDKCKKNKENIEKRWNKNNTVVYERKKTNTNYTDNDNDNDSDNEYDNELTTTVVNNVSDSCVDGLQKVIDFYNNNIGALTPYGLEVLQDYAKEIESGAIIYAMQISVEADKRNIKYIKAILNNWSKKGITTLIEAQKESQSFKGKKEDKKGNFEQREYKDLSYLYANGGS
jgi:DnaD/phage-associated family protein